MSPKAYTFHLDWGDKVGLCEELKQVFHQGHHSFMAIFQHHYNGLSIEHTVTLALKGNNI